jgi:PKD repeat protein
VNIRLVITDDDGANSTSFKYLTVIDPAPHAVFRASAYVIDVNGTVEFNAENTTDNPSDIDTLSFSWDFGDGTGGMGKTTSHKYTSAGNFTVKLTVQDDEGAWNTSDAVISVNIPSIPQPPRPNKPPADNSAIFRYLAILGILAFSIALISIALMRRKGPVGRA